MLYNSIIEKYNEIRNLGFAASLLHWDQATYMPKGGIESRASVSETIAKISHELLTNDDFYNDIVKLTSGGEFHTLSLFQQEEITEIKRNVEKARKIPVTLAKEIAKNSAIAESLWEEAKKNSDDSKFLIALDKNYKLKKEVAEHLGYEENPYDALLDEYDKDLKYKYIEPLFSSLKKELFDIIQTLENKNKKIENSFLFKYYEKDKQWNFGLKILKKFLPYFNNFRQDISAHPFTTTIGVNDVRITTNIDETNFTKGFFSTMHEGGHCLYELSAFKHLKDSPFATITSLSMHESQSRLFENIIGKSYLFWSNYYKELQELFPENLKNISLDDFYFSINKVEKAPIRIESDEVTYNLHIILRTEIENSLINNKENVSSIEEIWNEKTKEIFNFYPISKSQGYLQDIHWADSLIGYFPTYTLGNLISAQLFNSFEKEHGKVKTINDEILIKLVNWLDKNIYIYGSRKSSVDIVKLSTGESIKESYFINYIKDKFYKIYQ